VISNALDSVSIEAPKTESDVPILEHHHLTTCFFSQYRTRSLQTTEQNLSSAT
jgi:hypothetical protein